jgi:alkylhydroperoxidase family enzyme
MPRIPFPDQSEVPAELTAFLAQLPQDAVLGVLAHATATAKPFVVLGATMYTSLSLPPRARELAILTVASLCECDYVFAQHEPISELAGVTEDERTAIRSRRYDLGGFLATDRAVMEFAAETIRRPRVPDTVFDQVSRSFGNRGVVELLQLCGYYLAFARLCTVLDLEIEVHGPGVLEQIVSMRTD